MEYLVEQTIYLKILTAKIKSKKKGAEFGIYCQFLLCLATTNTMFLLSQLDLQRIQLINFLLIEEEWQGFQIYFLLFKASDALCWTNISCSCNGTNISCQHSTIFLVFYVYDSDGNIGYYYRYTKSLKKKIKNIQKKDLKMQRMDEGLAFLLQYEMCSYTKTVKLNIRQKSISKEIKFVICTNYLEVRQAIAMVTRKCRDPYTAAGMGMALAKISVSASSKEQIKFQKGFMISQQQDQQLLIE